MVVTLEKFTGRLKEKSASLDNLDVKQMAAISLTMLLLVLGAMLFDDRDVSTSYFMDNNTTLDYIEDNQIGLKIVHNRNNHPVIHDSERVKVCLYTSNEEPPVITEVGGEEKTFLWSNEIRSISINLSFSEDTISRNGLNQNMRVEKSNRCPIRSEPRIILVERD